jgi:transposase-like protein
VGAAAPGLLGLSRNEGALVGRRETVADPTVLRAPRGSLIPWRGAYRLRMRERVVRRVPKSRMDRAREHVEAELGKLGLSRNALPKRWPIRVKLAVLHVLALLRVQLAMLRAKASEETRTLLRQDARDALLQVVLVEKAILKRRLGSIDPRRRPHYSPEDRLKILELRAAQGWTLEQTAERFLVSVMTLTTWMKRVDEQGPNALVRAVPVNKYPDFVTRVVQAVPLAAPMFGNRRIAHIFGRLGLVSSPATVRRMRQKKLAVLPPPPAEGTASPAVPDPPAIAGAEDSVGPSPKTRATGTGVTSKHEHHVWHVDLTWLSFSLGDWVPWEPLALPKIFPFGLVLAAVMDQWTRRIVGWKLFLKEPSAAKIVAMLEPRLRAAVCA